MKKKILSGLFAVVVISFLAFGFVAITSHLSSQREHAEIPEFSFATLEGEEFTKADLNGGRPVIFVYANAECESCEEAAALLAAHKDELKSAQFVMVFPNDVIEVERYFEKVREIHELDNFVFVIDPYKNFRQLFGPGDFPSFFVYDKDGNFVAMIAGLSDINILTRYLES